MNETACLGSIELRMRSVGQMRSDGWSLKYIVKRKPACSACSKGLLAMLLPPKIVRCAEWWKEHQTSSKVLFALGGAVFGALLVLGLKQPIGTLPWTLAYLLPAIVFGVVDAFCDGLAFLGTQKDAFGSIQSIVATAGIIVGGWWALLRFGWKRENYPRAKLEHRVQFWDHSETEWRVRVSLVVKNDGSVLLLLRKGHTWVQQMKPHPKEQIYDFKGKTSVETTSSQVLWPFAGQGSERSHCFTNELEPGETDDIPMDFFIDKYFEQVLIYSYVENSAKPNRNIGWTIETVLDFADKAQTSTMQGAGEIISKERPQQIRNQEKLMPGNYMKRQGHSNPRPQSTSRPPKRDGQIQSPPKERPASGTNPVQKGK